MFWLGCRKHILELRLKWFGQAVVGVSKDPGSALFRRFQVQFTTLEDGFTKENLLRLDLTNKPEWILELARDTLQWAEELYKGQVFDRDDYHESLGWLIWHLGGTPERFFPVKMPGADDESRWMAKTIYYPKIFACSFLFPLSSKELQDSIEITEFFCLFYGRPLFEAAIASKAARSDLQFMAHMMHYYR